MWHTYRFKLKRKQINRWWQRSTDFFLFNLNLKWKRGMCLREELLFILNFGHYSSFHVLMGGWCYYGVFLVWLFFETFWFTFWLFKNKIKNSPTSHPVKYFCSVNFTRHVQLVEKLFLASTRDCVCPDGLHFAMYGLREWR